MLRQIIHSYGRSACLVGLLIAGATVAYAQDSPGNGGTSGGPPDPTSVPLDGGASLLLAGGIAYGLKHLRNRRQA